MKKRIVAILLVFAMSTFLFACGNESTQPTEQTETVESTEQQATEEIPTTDIADSTEAEPAEEPTTEQETAENTETEAPTAEQETAESTEPTEEATVQYTYTDLSTTMYAQQTVNVRNQPSTDGEKVGSLSTNQEVSVSGQCDETGWYRIAYSDGEAYVNNKYLGDSKVEVQQPAQNTPTNSTDNLQNTGADEPCPVDLYVVHDEGDMVYMWGEFHNRNAGDRSNPAFDQLFNYCVEKWGYNLSGYQDCDNHVWWYHDSFNDSLCRWVFVPSN